MAGTVTMACKLPNGLHMDLPGRPRVTLKGTAVPWGTPPVIVPGGFALTPEVDEDFAKEWLRLYAKFTPVETGLVYAMSKPNEAMAKAREFGDLKSGLEPMNQNEPGQGLEKLSA